MGGGFIPIFIASSKTLFNPDCVKAEHSRNLIAPSCFARSIPCLVRIAVGKFDSKSNLVPTRINGVYGQ